LGSTAQVFYTPSLNQNLSDMFLMISWGDGFREEEHRDKVPFLPHHIKSTY
jgi:hypothetical protein